MYWKVFSKVRKIIWRRCGFFLRNWLVHFLKNVFFQNQCLYVCKYNRNPSCPSKQAQNVGEKKFCLLIVSLKSTNLKELVIDVLNFVRNLCDLNGELFLLNLYLLVTFEYKSHFACFNILPQRLSAYWSEP